MGILHGWLKRLKNQNVIKETLLNTQHLNVLIYLTVDPSLLDTKEVLKTACNQTWQYESDIDQDLPQKINAGIKAEEVVLVLLIKLPKTQPIRFLEEPLLKKHLFSLTAYKKSKK